MTMDTPGQHGNQFEHLGHQSPDQDSSSTQSTDQSHKELSGSSEVVQSTVTPITFSALRHSLQIFQFLQIQELQTLVIKD
ncbi:nuclear transcription factor Y subunit A-7-like [Iris pallida]|uniref:Nuclear transcription factor Y subunit A-7-like n=1 Tax=Iris pallida TaxID=29817 RepID=A0AAX6GYB7_IRIPA|nr:nuclear transcription factor Y subunit A-7-like [Iris pallida]